jgi:hypothetical protein
MKILNRNPSIISDKDDRRRFMRTQSTYNLSWYSLILSFPVSFYLTRQMGRDPSNSGKYIVRNSIVSTGSLLFFLYGMLKMGSMESELT